MAKNKEKIKVSFLGEASNDVTGSMVLVETSTTKILLECGLYQSCKPTIENYRINNRKFDFRADQISYVFLQHIHTDHAGLVPLLFKRGGHPRVIAPKGTASLERILLEDSARIMDSDVLELNKKTGKSYAPIYTQDDVESCLSAYEEYDIGQIIELDDNVKFQFIPSGHIINSAQLILWVKEGNLTKKIVYTSDLGNIHIDKYYTNKFKKERKCDLFIGETTYANNSKIANLKVRKKDLEKLKSSIIQTCVENHARLMIPVFALDRCQNMATFVYDMLHDCEEFGDIPVYIDSPMATKICKEYFNLLSGDDAEKWQRVLSWKNLYFIDSSEESKDIRDSKHPCVVLCSSGMIVGKGRSTAWACSILPRVNDKIVFCGYSAEGSIGYIIKEGKQKTITISGKRWKNKCQVDSLTSFTSHMQSDSLLDYYGSVDAGKIVLVHGNMDGKIAFAEQLRKKLSNNDLTTKVVVAQKDIVVNL